jgi:hypothetical protein
MSLVNNIEQQIKKAFEIEAKKKTGVKQVIHETCWTKAAILRSGFLCCVFV